MSFDSKTDILALDFDGVIVDSIKECLVSGYNAYANYTHEKNIERYDDLDPHWVKCARAMRNYIRNGEDYVYIAHALANKIAVKSQRDFDDFAREHAALRQSFFNFMLNHRIDFSESKPDLWAALNPLYEGMREFIVNYSNKNNFYIITTKKLLFVHKILAANKIQLIRENIFDTSADKSKKEIIEDILRDRHIRPEQFYFIDDQVDTLIKVQATGVQCLLATWGYNNPEQRRLAENSTIELLGLDRFIEEFSG
ncbi:HAD family hydrolase [candidate division KSB1 bacterium]|nr:HAD family hydrolase [candidate division KSB1 bacterium]RQW03111.1 MAG: HAD family hydrolase [candidate division KSB1 bacterium]